MKITATRRLKDQHRIASEAMDRDLQCVARAEFPVGTRVKWIRTFKGDKPVYLEGVVDRTGEYQFTLKTKSGASFSKYPWELYFADDAAGEQKL